MAEAAIGGHQPWGALRLTSSLAVAGFKGLADFDEDASMLKWSSDVVVAAHEKQAQHLEGRTHETGARSDLASARATVEEYRAENMEFFESFMASLKATRQGTDLTKSAALEEIKMSLKNFATSQGNPRFLAEAHSKAKAAFGNDPDLDVKITAAVVAVSTGYVYTSKTSSPDEAKNFTVKGTLTNIVRHFRSIWMDPATTTTADGKKVLTFILNIVSCVCVLPSEDAPVLPKLDTRLFPVLGTHCAADPELRKMYPDVALSAVRTMPATGARPGQGAYAGGDTRTDRAALMALFRSSKGRPKTMFGSSAPGGWVLKTAWGSNHPLGNWLGISVDGGGRVLKIDLERNGLTGTLPGALGGLSALQSLNLSNNTLLGGRIPPELGDLMCLEGIFMSDCGLSGTIPPTLGNLSLVKILDVGGNRLTGPIPPALGGMTSMEMMNLQGNRLTGAIPATLCEMAHLRLFSIYGGNKLSGPIPEALGRWKSMEHLSLDGNKFVGPIAVVGEMSRLNIVGINNTSVTGPIPATLGELAFLDHIELTNNKLSGPIPAALGSGRLRTCLTVLDLCKNQLSGPIPAELGNLLALTYLDLENNQLSGEIPPELGRLRALKMLDLSKNRLSGRIPSEISGLRALGYLAVHGNRLTGAVPKVRFRVSKKH